MRQIERQIEEVKEIRGDLSNWLVHLTKNNIFKKSAGKSISKNPKDCLESILNQDIIRSLIPIGHFSYSKWYPHVQPDDLKAVCFTETPIEEIFLFSNIKKKSLRFSSYGLVFSKYDLAKAPYFTAPVMYFSQPDGNRHYLDTIRNMGSNTRYTEFKEILFLFHSFGRNLQGKDHDFRWEREWRKKGDLENVQSLVKFGLCPENDIGFFENKFPSITFVDPFFNPKQIKKRLEQRGILCKSEDSQRESSPPERSWSNR